MSWLKYCQQFYTLTSNTYNKNGPASPSTKLKILLGNAHTFQIVPSLFHIVVSLKQLLYAHFKYHLHFYLIEYQLFKEHFLKFTRMQEISKVANSFITKLQKYMYFYIYNYILIVWVNSCCFLKGCLAF